MVVACQMHDDHMLESSVCSASRNSWHALALTVSHIVFPDIILARADGSMSASGSAGPGFNPRWRSKF